MKKILNVIRAALLGACSLKIFRIMKLTAVLLLISIIDVFGSETYSQNAKLNLDMKDVTIQAVLNAIESQSEFSFFYRSEMIDVTKKVDIHAENKVISEVLGDLLAETDIKYAVNDRQILLANKGSESSSSVQQLTVTGKVVDSQTGLPMPGVNILVKGTLVGTLSDLNGIYSIAVSEQNAILVASFIGYTSLEVPVSGKSKIDLVLTPTVQQLEEVVVIGYGTAKKKDLTGAVASVKTELIENEKPQAVQDILRGTIAGLEVGFATTAKGGGDLQIRGLNSLKTNSSPLIVMDGVIYPGDISDINPNDILTIDVLKDASSSAVFGARAANGVILISTKKGKSGKPVINFNSSIGLATLAKVAKVYGPYDFIDWRTNVMKSLNRYNPTMMNKLYVFDNPDKLSSDITIDMWKDGNTSTDLTTIWLNRLAMFPAAIDRYKAGTFVDWNDVIFQNGFRQDYNLSLSGKKDDIAYYYSVGYLIRIITGL
jgi:TonB-dependent starch-binding outer membrane protein SusC